MTASLKAVGLLYVPMAGPQREVDYRNLCLATLAKLEKVALDRDRWEREDRQHIAKWLLQQLAQVLIIWNCHGRVQFVTVVSVTLAAPHQ